MSPANDGETESTLFFRFDEGGCGAAGSGLCAFGGLALYSAEFFCVCEDEVHVLRRSQLQYTRAIPPTNLVERQHLPSHLSPVI